MRAASRRSFARSARLAAYVLLIVWIGPVTFVQTDTWRVLQWMGAPNRAAAESQVIPAGMALVIEPGKRLELKLKDGRTVYGPLVRRTLLDPDVYAPRFEARSRFFAPLALGETLQVDLHDSRQWAAPFAGYAELALLLRSPETGEYVRVPFESVSEIRRAGGERVAPLELVRAFHDRLLPSAEALEIESRATGSYITTRASTQLVAVEDIEYATLHTSQAGTVVGVVVIGVVLGTILGVILIASAFNSADDNCGGSSASYPTPFGVTLTDRPFDLQRRCYVGDPWVVADPWPGAVAGPALALARADSVMLDVPGGPTPATRQLRPDAMREALGR